MTRLRIATYNIHKCVGMDRRYSPSRVADVLRELDADVIGLQEVLCSANDHQAEYLADELGMDFRLGENRKHRGADYGNAVLSRLPIASSANHDISVHSYEPRGCLHTEIDLDGAGPIHFMNVHMGTSYFERRKQVHRMLDEHVIDHPSRRGRRIIAGDFNEWINGVTTRLFKANFSSVDAKAHLGRARTFPGLAPLVHLDHVYFDDAFRLLNAHLHRSRAALLASDHLPIVAEFEV